MDITEVRASVLDRWGERRRSCLFVLARSSQRLPWSCVGRRASGALSVGSQSSRPHIEDAPRSCVDAPSCPCVEDAWRSRLDAPSHLREDPSAKFDDQLTYDARNNRLEDHSFSTKLRG